MGTYKHHQIVPHRLAWTARKDVKVSEGVKHNSITRPNG